MIITQLQSVNTKDLQTYFNLLSVLARDLKNDLQPHFQKLMQTFLTIVNSVAYSTDATKGLTAVNPELTGEMFECVSHLLRYHIHILNVICSKYYCINLHILKLIKSSMGYFM